MFQHQNGAYALDLKASAMTFLFGDTEVDEVSIFLGDDF